MNDLISIDNSVTFFDYGHVNLTLCDSVSRQAMFDICMPCCLFQTVTPHLLNGGYIDDLKIRDPISIWIPKLTVDRFNDAVRSVQDIDNLTNNYIKEEIERVGKLYTNLQNYLIDPSDIIPILPLGVYITFFYRCNVDSIPAILEGIESIKVVGIKEFQWSLAVMMRHTLLQF